MAIRFQCAACSEPIEVDDHWARQVVRCPYCQRTVTAPAESTLPESERIPTGRPLRRIIDERSGEESQAAEITLPPPPAYAPVPTNRAATAALVLACVMMGLLGLAVMVLSRHTLEAGEMQEQIQKAREGGAGFAQAMMAYLDERGGRLPTWIIVFDVMAFGAFAAGLAALVLGVIGLVRPYRRAFAVAALLISGSFCLLLCLVALTSAM